MAPFQPSGATAKTQLQDALAFWSLDATTAVNTYGPISEWDVSRVTDMSRLFEGATSFDGDISKWDVSSVTDMSLMFWGATSFRIDISWWKLCP